MLVPGNRSVNGGAYVGADLYIFAHTLKLESDGREFSKII